MVPAPFASMLAVLLLAHVSPWCFDCFTSHGQIEETRKGGAKRESETREVSNAAYSAVGTESRSTKHLESTKHKYVVTIFCLRSASNPTTSELYRQTAPVDHAHQLSISACGSNHVQWVSGVGVLLWSQHT